MPVQCRCFLGVVLGFGLLGRSGRVSSGLSCLSVCLSVGLPSCPLLAPRLSLEHAPMTRVIMMLLMMIMIMSLCAPFDNCLPVQCRLVLFLGDVFLVGAFSS